MTKQEFIDLVLSAFNNAQEENMTCGKLWSYTVMAIINNHHGFSDAFAWDSSKQHNRVRTIANLIANQEIPPLAIIQVGKYERIIAA